MKSMRLRSSLLLYYALLAVGVCAAFTACKNEATTAPDPRDAYLGTWYGQISNGQPVKAGAPRDTMVITKSGNANLQIAMLIRSGPFTVSPGSAGSGYQADNTPIKTGTTYLFQSGTRVEVTLNKLTMVLTGDQLTVTSTYGAKAGTQTAEQNYIDILKKP